MPMLAADDGVKLRYEEAGSGIAVVFVHEFAGDARSDEEEPCLEVCLLMKRAIRGAGLAILPKSGHGINLEEPELFNRLLEDFFHQVESGRWAPRDPRSPVASIYGPGGKPEFAK